MFIDRRGFALSGSAALLSACATVPRSEPCTPLPPVRVEPGRILGSYACLRPYRASGFVVRAEQLGDIRLVHNYGHGGAGITLSWGSSTLATGLGLPGHRGPVAVIGAGIMGLTTARLVQEAGLPVTVYCADLPPNTTSNLAGGQWGPTGHYREDAVNAGWKSQYHAVLAISWNRFRALDGERYGIRWLDTYTEPERIAPPGLEPYYPGARVLASSDHPFPEASLAVYRTMYVEVGRYLSRLAEEVLRSGGAIRVRRFSSPQQLMELDERLVFNCTGLGARDLFGDLELGPVRGQIVVLQPQDEVRYALNLPMGYMFPRPDGILLGGTFERDEWTALPDAGTIARILASHRRFFDGFRCSA